MSVSIHHGSTPSRTWHCLARLAAALALTFGMAPCGGSSSGDPTIGAYPKDGDLTGLVTSYSDATHLSVEGVPVNASGAPSVPANLVQVSRVEVEGDFVNGSLVANAVEHDEQHCADDDRDDDCSGHVEDDEL